MRHLVERALAAFDGEVVSGAGRQGTLCRDIRRPGAQVIARRQRQVVARDYRGAAVLTRTAGLAGGERHVTHTLKAQAAAVITQNYSRSLVLNLKGNWLQEAGFEYGQPVTVTVEQGRLIICLAGAE